MTLLSLSEILDRRGMAFLSLAMLMAFTGISFAAFYVMIQPTESVSKQESTQLKGVHLKSALGQLKSHLGSLPAASPLLYLVSDVEGTGCSMNLDSGSGSFQRLQGWCGPYIDSVWQSESNAFMLDGWGTAFQVEASGEQILRSCGPDRICGGANSNDDLLF
ncbi:MAG: hypothetical protein KGQ59_00855 [Bdellovibrionales bacterium]|nr:hypothetical protein [Bdellovibrionales bacterium]